MGVFFAVDYIASTVYFFFWLFKNVNKSQHKLCHCYFPVFTLGERVFPPPSGLSYSSWFCIEHFSAPPNNHPVRLLTVVRRANSSEQHYVCLTMVLSAKDRSLIVSTKEELLQNYGQSLFFLFASCDHWKFYIDFNIHVLRFIWSFFSNLNYYRLEQVIWNLEYCLPVTFKVLLKET